MSSWLCSSRIRTADLELDVNLSINGYNQSTNISSLSEAFQSLALEAALPGLKSQLLGSTTLKGKNLVSLTDPC